MMDNLMRSRQIYQLFRVSFVSLPYLFYISLVGLGATIFASLAVFRRTALDPLTRYCLLLITGLMLLGCLQAFNRAEACLQLANFLPYFLLFSVLPFLLKGIDRLEQVAFNLVVAAIPINLLAFGEYILRADWLPRSIRRLPLVHWVRARPHEWRAMVMFDHPNALASYLVLMLGLGLGLILCHSIRRRERYPLLAPDHPGMRLNAKTILLYSATYLNLLGIFSAGSRNGLVVAVSQLLLFSLCTKRSRLVLLTGVVSLLGIVAGAAWLGIGGRSLSLLAWTDDPRVPVWELALKLIQERPWLGWGLGNFKLLYPPGLIPGYKYIAHPHNFWLLLASEAGIVVMLLFTAMVGYICFRGVRLVILKRLSPIDRSVMLAYLLAFWGCIAFALFDVTFYDARLNVTNWVMLAGIYAIAQQVESAEFTKSMESASSSPSPESS